MRAVGRRGGGVAGVRVARRRRLNPSVSKPEALADAVLVKLAAAGDVRAFTTLYARHKEYAMRLALRFTGDHEAAADVVQETFIYLMKKMPSLELTAKMTTYLYPVVKNIAFTAKRKDRARLRLVREDGSDLETPAPPVPQAGRDPNALATLVDLLPEHQREVLLMRFVDDMSMEQIAAALSIPVGTVKSRLHLAIRVLREDPRTAAAFGGADGISETGGLAAGAGP